MADAAGRAETRLAGDYLSFPALLPFKREPPPSLASRLAAEVAGVYLGSGKVFGEKPPLGGRSFASVRSSLNAFHAMIR
jgi:hypothetical protein